MKGGTSLAEKSEAMKELQSVATEIGKGSPSHKATKAKQKEPSNKNKRELLTPTAAGKKNKQKVSPPTKPKTLKPQKKRKMVAPKGSPSVLEFPPLNFPGTGKKPKLIYGNSIVYFSPGRYRVMRNKNDIVDKAFSYLVDTPKKAWKKVCAELRRVNPRE